MKFSKPVALILSALLIILLTAAVLGRVPWIAFWIFALALYLYLKTSQRH